MNPRNALHFLPFMVVVSLAGCIQDSASYLLPEKDHAITLVRNQTFFWESNVDIELIAIRLPECNDGIKVEGVPRDEKIALYQAPDEYPEPIFILKTGKRLYAVSTQSCQVQLFKDVPADLGERLGEFYEKDGKFKFVAEKPVAAGAPAAKEE